MRAMIAALVLLVAAPAWAEEQCYYWSAKTEEVKDFPAKFVHESARPTVWWITPWKRQTRLAPGHYKIDTFVIQCGDEMPSEYVRGVMMEMDPVDTFMGPPPKRN